MKSPLASFYLLGLLACTSSSWAQPTPHHAGLYRSAEDFSCHRLVPEVNDQQPTRVRLNEFGSRPYVTVMQQGQKYKLAKATLFGYCDRAGNEYRFVGSHRLLILNPTEEVLLYKVEQAAIGKTPGYVRLYFSTSTTAPVQPLTLLNLKKAFPNNELLHDILDAQFHSGSDLAAWDGFHSMTKLNWLLQRSQVLAEAR